jgi:hypothetical protein
MSRLKYNSDDDGGNSEPISYQIQCVFEGYKGDLRCGLLIVLSLSLLFIGANIIKSLFFWFFLSFVLTSPIAFIMIYYGIKKYKRKSIIVTLVKKKHIAGPDGEESDHLYYFYTDINTEYSGCERLYNFLQGNETVRVIVKDNTICGLVKVIDINVGGSEDHSTKDVL